MHIRHAVAADEIDVDVKDVRTFLLLRLRQVDEPVPVLGLQQVAHLLRARCIYPLADDQERRVLRVRLLEIDRRCRWSKLGITHLRRESADAVDHHFQMFRRRAAAAADDACPEVFRKVLDLCGKAFRCFVVVLLAVFHLGQTGVRQNRDRDRRILAKIHEAVGHLLRPGAAVHPDNVDRERLKRRQGRTDLGPVEHCAEGLDRHLSDDRQPHFMLGKVVKDRRECRLCLQEVLARLDDQNVRAAIDQPADLLDVSLFQVAIGDVPERRKLRPGPDRTRDKTRLVRRRIIPRQPLCELGRFLVHVIRLFDDAELRQHDLAAAKTVRFDHVAADFQEAAMHRLDRVRPRIEQILRAILKLRPAPVVKRQLQRLQIAPHRPVKNDDSFLQ